ncbi:hypothetical protein ACOSP7_019396 [Xanthoceras sorbifolium]
MEVAIPPSPQTEVIHKSVGPWMAVSHIRGNRNFQGNGYGRYATSSGNRMDKDTNRGGYAAGFVKNGGPSVVNMAASGSGGSNLISGAGGFNHTKTGKSEVAYLKTSATEQNVLNNEGVAKEKFGFKYVETNVKAAGKSGGSRFDVLKDLEAGDSDIGKLQKGKATEAKQKGVLSEVTNLKLPTANSKKHTKAKVTSLTGDTGNEQRKKRGSTNKGKKQLIQISSSEQDKVYSWPVIPAPNSSANIIDNLQSAREENGVLQQLHQDIMSTMKTDKQDDNIMTENNRDCQQPSEDGNANKVDISKADERYFKVTASKLKEAMQGTTE